MSERECVPEAFAIKRKPDYGYNLFIDGQRVPWVVVARPNVPITVEQTEVPGLRFVTLTIAVEGPIELDESLAVKHVGNATIEIRRPEDAR